MRSPASFITFTMLVAFLFGNDFSQEVNAISLKKIAVLTGLAAGSQGLAVLPSSAEEQSSLSQTNSQVNFFFKGKTTNQGSGFRVQGS